MGLGKTYSTKYLLDSNNNSGVAGQVLISTATGVNWSDGTDIIGGPYLPLAGGTMTGNLVLSNNTELRWEDSVGTEQRILELVSSDLLELAGPSRIRILPGNSTAIDLFSGHNTKYAMSSVHAFFDASASEAVRIDGTGNVGIGTTSPGQKLQISGGNSATSATALFSIQKNEEGYGLFSGILGSGVTWIQSSTETESTYYGLSLQPNGGNVGIGTTSPGYKLDVYGQGFFNSGIITNTAVAVKLKQAAGTLNDATEFRVGGGEFKMYSGRDSGSHQAFVFATGDNYTSGAERMRIIAGGNVGIGTTTPTEKLSVSGNIELDDMPANGTRYLMTNETSTGTGRLNIQAGGGSAAYGGGLSLIANSHASKPGWVIAGISSGAGTVGGATEGRFIVNAHGLGTGTDLFTVLRTGNVGIGTTSPGVKLHIAATGAPDVRIQDLDGTNQYGDRGHNGGVTTYVSRNNTSFGSHVFYSADGTTTQARVIFSQDFGTGSSLVTATGAAGSSYGGFLAVSSVATAQMWASDGGLIYIGSRSNHSVNFSVNNQIKMMINTSGNVGIGTTTPNVGRLEVGGPSPTLAINSSTNTDPTLFLLRNGGTNGIGLLKVRDGGHLSFDTGATGAAQSEKMRILANGNVGIGITGPAKKLTVATDTVNDGVYITTSGGTNVARIGTSSTATSGALALLAGGSTKVFISAKANENSYFNGGGNVGIGTTSPGYPLEVQSGGVGTVLRAGTAFVSIDSVGTASAPSLVFNGDTNTGIFRAASDTLGFSTAGSERMRIDSSGNVGIGTTNPAQNFVVSNSTNGQGVEIIPGTTGTIQAYNRGTSVYVPLNIDTLEARVRSIGATVFNNGSGFSESMRITSAGNVGIGTTSVTTHRLIVSGGSNIASFRSEGSGQNLKKLSISTGGDRVVLDASTTADAVTAFAFQTGGSERMRITSGSDVGIGTTLPNSKLTVWDVGQTFDARTSGINVHRPNSYGQYGSFSYDGAATHFTSTYTGNAAVGYGTFVFKQYNNGTVGRNALEILNDGNFIFNQYAGSALTGTPTYLLGTDGSGNVVKTLSSAAPGSLWAASGNDIYNTNSANVGIGTSTPYAYDTTSTKLHVKNQGAVGTTSEVARFGGSEDGNGSASIVRITTSNDRGIYLEGGRTGVVSYGSIGTTEYDGTKTESIFLDSLGNVGIGTSTPDGKLEIASNTSLSSYVTQYTNDADGAELVIRTARGTESTPIQYNTNDSAGRLLFQAYTSSGAFKDAASIESVMESGSANAYGGLRFNYMPTTSPYVLTEGMRLKANGNVGIGTIPDTKLHVAGNIRATGQTLYLSTSSTFNKIALNGTDMQIYSGSLTPAIGISSDGNLSILGDLELSSSSSIVLDDQPTASTASGSGTIVKWSVSETTTAGLLYAVKTTGGWTTTDADVENRSIYMLGIALSTNANLGMLLQGFFYKSAHGFTIGLPLYISNTAGAFTTTRPTGTNDYVRIIGYATSANYIYFDPDKTWVQVA